MSDVAPEQRSTRGIACGSPCNQPGGSIHTVEADSLPHLLEPPQYLDLRTHPTKWTQIKGRSNQTRAPRAASKREYRARLGMERAVSSE